MASQHGTPGGPRAGRRSATPYELFTGQGAGPSASGSGAAASPFRTVAGRSSALSGSGTPLRSGTSALGAGTLLSPASLRSISSETGSPFRRNVPFGSPGLRAPPSAAAAASAGAADSPRQGMQAQTPNKPRSSRFVRRKPWTERAAALPVDLYHSLSMRASIYMNDLQELPPEFGWILGGLLHFLSVLAHVLSPDSEFSVQLPSIFGGGSLFSRGPRARALGDAAASASSAVAGAGGKGKSMFLNDRKGAFRAGLGAGPSPAEQMRRLASMQREAWLRATSILLSLSLLIIASYNAYYLFVQARRRYTLWHKSSDEPIRSVNARLIPVVQREDQRPTIGGRVKAVGERVKVAVLAFIMAQLRKVPVLKWFLPRDYSAWRSGNRDGTPMMYALDVWRAPELNLSIFCVYSPIHALWYHFAALLGVKGPISWLATWLVMAGLSWQMHWVVREFQALLKDRQTISSEVMREYEQNFVMPRAMPIMRDASVSTSEAETLSAADWSARKPAQTPRGRASRPSGTPK